MCAVDSPLRRLYAVRAAKAWAGAAAADADLCPLFRHLPRTLPDEIFSKCNKQ